MWENKIILRGEELKVLYTETETEKLWWLLEMIVFGYFFLYFIYFVRVVDMDNSMRSQTQKTFKAWVHIGVTLIFPRFMFQIKTVSEISLCYVVCNGGREFVKNNKSRYFLFTFLEKRHFYTLNTLANFVHRLCGILAKFCNIYGYRRHSIITIMR